MSRANGVAPSPRIRLLEYAAQRLGDAELAARLKVTKRTLNAWKNGTGGYDVQQGACFDGPNRVAESGCVTAPWRIGMKPSNVIRFPLERVRVRHAIESSFSDPVLEHMKKHGLPLIPEMYALVYAEGKLDQGPGELDTTIPEELR